MELYFYLAVLFGFAVLAFLSRHEKTPQESWEEGGGKVSPLRRPFLKMAAFLTRQGRRFSFRKKILAMQPGQEKGSVGERGVRERGTGEHSVGERGMGEISDGLPIRRRGASERVRANLRLLYPSGAGAGRERDFRLWQGSTLLLFLLLADLLALAAYAAGAQQGAVGEDGRIARAPYDGAAETIVVQAGPPETDSAEGGRQPPGEAGQAALYGEYAVEIAPRRHTPQELSELAQEAFAALERGLAGENPSLQRVSGPLRLPEQLEGYPFQISWESSRSDLVDGDGTVRAQMLEEGQEANVVLTAVLLCGDERYERQYAVTVAAPVQTPEEKLRGDIQEALRQSEEQTAYEPWYRLPEEAGGRPLVWREQREDYSLLLFGLLAAAGVLGAAGMNGDLQRRVKRRERQLQVDYPQLVSRFVLFLGAGMSVRNVFFKLGQEYEARLQKGGGRRFVYEELLLVCRELESGVSEGEAYGRFGVRCRLRRYTKFCALLTQNQRRGNRELLSVLQEEAREAFEERKNLVRQLGEEASARLLVPMIMMLGVTMVMIIVPAYGSFAV